MQKSHKSRWLQVIAQAVHRFGWEPTRLVTFDRDALTFVVVVRKSPIAFIVRQSPGDRERYTISYSNDLPGVSAEPVQTNTGSLRLLSADTVSKELEDWLVECAARYIAENHLQD